MDLNLQIFQLIHSLAGQSHLLDNLGIFLANYLPYLLGLAGIYFIFRKDNWKNKWLKFSIIALSVIFARGILDEVIHFIYFHPRPFAALSFQPLIPESGTSFPSGHTSFFFALSMAIYYFDKRWGIWFFILSFFVGVARIFVGVHWPYDILGGIAVGLLSGWLAIMLLRKYLSRPALDQKLPD